MSSEREEWAREVAAMNKFWDDVRVPGSAEGGPRDVRQGDR
jgi:hypothetical protein